MEYLRAPEAGTTPAAPKNDWFIQGVKAAWPICLGYVPIGLAFGVLARQAGLPTWAVAAMSLFVFAGSAQFICVAMLSAGASLKAIVVTTLMVNLRHILMSSTLAVYLHGVHRWFLSLFAYGITDESFAVNMTRFREGGWNRFAALTLHHTANIAWVLSTIIGSAVGQFIPRGALGTDYALTAMFICLLVFQLQSRLFIVTALITGFLAVAWNILIPGDSYIIGASVCGATIGYLLKRRRRLP
ncbi:MAG: branched-chain amino acid ABC transporter permease [Deltaproteobacteria bacterium]|nr:MAG: branched-chain amino acid ABC transporter permease [Deltaproteobacteria bacterium]